MKKNEIGHPLAHRENRQMTSSTLTPLDFYEGFGIRPGFFLDNGATVIPEGINFTVQSTNATSCTLVIFPLNGTEPLVEIPFQKGYRMGGVFSMIVFGLDFQKIEYAYRMDGPFEPERGLRFDSTKLLLDPYCRAIVGQRIWGIKASIPDHYHSRIVSSDFNWGNVTHPLIPMKDLIIYELHVRGYTKNSNSNTKKPGTYQALAEKIPYLKELGINAVELMPIFEFDEMQSYRIHKGKELVDYWGYNPIGFFAPNTAYAASQERNREGLELKKLIKELHENQIAVILDVVFNHTAEGDEQGPTLSFKGLDNSVYYMLTPDGKYYNFSGCGNTMNANHPIVQNMILECLRYWVSEYRIDGFRFDLASILGRNEDGSPSNNPPLLKSLAFDPILSNVYLIAEAWDAGGLYQVGSFPSWKRWSEWNGLYRDTVRRYLKGETAQAYSLAQRISGSHDLYHPMVRGDHASVNFVTCHDGFTMMDLYSYNEKHNEDNGWNNTDGEQSNHSWNCGVEGPTEDPAILALRLRMVKNACAILLASHGVPMLLSGDEFGNTQYGNNNAYCQDNFISWLDWSMLEKNKEIFNFFQKMIQLRKKHFLLRSNGSPAKFGLPPVSYHGHHPWHLNAGFSNFCGVMFSGRNEEMSKDEAIYIAINNHWETQDIELPELPGPYSWRITLDTAAPVGHEIDYYMDQYKCHNNRLTITDRSVILLVSKRTSIKST